MAAARKNSPQDSGLKPTACHSLPWARKLDRRASPAALCQESFLLETSGKSLTFPGLRSFRC